ncbi:MAG: LuxR C-terminal-related transcriptional regulator [Myxococcales bacterium]|nr:LuxR C-terminal-related transcriptional regulator [Myxococcales bacterium]
MLDLDGPDPELMQRLRPSEQEVALGLVAGKSQSQIALERGTSKRTVANQIARIFALCGVGSKLELARVLAATPGAAPCGTGRRSAQMGTESVCEGTRS